MLMFEIVAMLLAFQLMATLERKDEIAREEEEEAWEEVLATLKELEASTETQDDRPIVLLAPAPPLLYTGAPDSAILYSISLLAFSIFLGLISTRLLQWICLCLFSTPEASLQL